MHARMGTNKTEQAVIALLGRDCRELKHPAATRQVLRTTHGCRPPSSVSESLQFVSAGIRSGARRTPTLPAPIAYDLQLTGYVDLFSSRARKLRRIGVPSNPNAWRNSFSR